MLELETVTRKVRQKGGFLLRLLRRALEHFHGDLPSPHKRCGTSRASHKCDAVLADDHLRLLYAHRGPLRDGKFIGNLRPIPIVRAELFEKILDGDPLLFLRSFGYREPWVEEGRFERDVVQLDHVLIFLLGEPEDVNPLQRFLRQRRTQINPHPDRKSTRLNSSHANISYAV